MRLRTTAAGVIVALCALYGALAPAQGQERFVDQVINRETVQSMRGGAGYYSAMDQALRRNGGPVASDRAFRLPTAFVVWRWVPGGGRGIWLLFVALTALTGLLLLRITPVPAVVPLVVWYLLNAARPHVGGTWVDQDLLVELWVVPVVAGLLVAWQSGREWAAAALAALATAVRELAAGLIIGGLVAAHLLKRPRRPWIAAAGAAVAVYALHVVLASSHVVAHGNEIALLGTGGPRRVATMMGVALPGPLLVGPVLWLLAVARLATDRELRVLLALYVTLPLTGFLVGRDYWGFLVVPFTILWAGEAVVLAAGRGKHMFAQTTSK